MEKTKNIEEVAGIIAVEQMLPLSEAQLLTWNAVLMKKGIPKGVSEGVRWTFGQTYGE